MVIIKLENISKKYYIPHEKNNTLSDIFISLLRRKNIEYEELEVLKNINLEVEKGEFLGIIGDNGSGKSTILKIISGVIKPDLGKVTVSEKIFPLLELGVGFNGELTAKENVYLYGTILGLNRKEIDLKFQEIIDFAELERFIDTKIKNFSSGMVTRLAFATATQVNVPIILIDEILVMGDLGFQKKCFMKLNEYKKKDKTVIMVSHDLAIISYFCTRSLWINKGRIVKSGNTNKVIQFYKSEFLPKNKEHFLKLIILARKILEICVKLNIQPYLMGSLAYFFYTEEEIDVEDIDLLIEINDLEKIKRHFELFPEEKIKDYYYIEDNEKYNLKKCEFWYDIYNISLNELQFQIDYSNSLQASFNNLNFNIIKIEDLIRSYEIGIEKNVKIELYSKRIETLKKILKWNTT